MRSALLLIVVATCSVSAFTVQPLPQHISTQRSSSSRLPPPIALAKKKKGGGGGGGGAKVQCVLLADVKGVGRKGELVEVKPAYAENMLIRTGLGEKATPDILEKLATEKAEADAAAVAAKQAAVDTNEKLIALFKEKGAVLKKKANPDSGQIFGKITPTEVCVRARRGLGSRFIIHLTELVCTSLSLSLCTLTGRGAASGARGREHREEAHHRARPQARWERHVHDPAAQGCHVQV